MGGRLHLSALAATSAALFATAAGCHSGSSAGTVAGDAAIDTGHADAGVGPVDAGTPVDATPVDAMDAAASSDGPGSSSPCPVESALVTADSGTVCVDLYEGALVQHAADGGESPWPWYLPVDSLDAGTVRAVPAKGIFPQGYISQVQATAACNASGKRLCTFAEWTAACRGQPMDDYVYPYGNTYEAGRCNEGRPSPIGELFGPNPSYDNQELNDPRCDQLEGGLAQGGAYSGCESAYGAFDMHGNIHEWIDDTTANGTGVFLGGYFVDAKINGPGCEYMTTAHAKTYHDYSTGFRCCSDPSVAANGD